LRRRARLFRAIDAIGQAEPLGMLDHHDGRLRNIDTDLDDRGRDEDLVDPSAKAAIAASLSRLFILPWTSPTLSPKTSRR